uniref:Uncharacterized protein n=1 Tax=Knipowitschia caucasica TaxID=637954 RepID=A0AAV2K9Q6_KNICA
MAEATQLQQPQQTEALERKEDLCQNSEDRDEDQDQSSTEGSTESEDSSEEGSTASRTPTRPLLSIRSQSTMDMEDDSPNMIVYRKVRQAGTITCDIIQIQMIS